MQKDIQFCLRHQDMEINNLFRVSDLSEKLQIPCNLLFAGYSSMCNIHLTDLGVLHEAGYVYSFWYPPVPPFI